MHAVVPTSIVVEGVPTELVGTGVPTSFVVAIPTRLVGTAYNRKSCGEQYMICNSATNFGIWKKTFVNNHYNIFGNL